jgi:hypothetical protein
LNRSSIAGKSLLAIARTSTTCWTPMPLVLANLYNFRYDIMSSLASS